MSNEMRCGPFPSYSLVTNTQQICPHPTGMADAPSVGLVYAVALGEARGS